MTRVIDLPAIGRRVTIGQYVAAVKKAKANPDARFPHGLTCWWPQTGAQIVQQFREGMHDRINQGVSYEWLGCEQLHIALPCATES